MDVHPIDDLFASLDVKKQGEIKTAALKSAIKKMQSDAASKAATAQRTKAIAEKFRAAAALFESARELAVSYELAAEEVQKLNAERTIDARLGEVLRKRNIKIAEVVTQWDKDRGGSVDLDEFSQRSKEIGLKAEPAELKDIFARWGPDSSGELGIEGLKESLRKLQEASAAEVDHIKELKHQVSLVSK